MQYTYFKYTKDWRCNMSTCAFFGHSSCPNSIQPELKNQIEFLIKNHSVRTFLLGDHGNFDVLVLKTIKELSTYNHYLNNSNQIYLTNHLLDLKNFRNRHNYYIVDRNESLMVHQN